MTQESARRVRRIYGLILSAAIIIAGVCLMAQCVSIYRSGDQPFSRQAVAAHFSPIAIPVYLCLGLTAAGFLLELFLPGSRQKRKLIRQEHMLLAGLTEKKDLSGCSDEIRTGIEAQKKYRARMDLISAAVFVICSVIFLSYGANPANFHQTEINGSMLGAMAVLAPCCGAALLWGLWAEGKKAASVRREIELWKQAPAAASPAPAKASRAAAVRWVIVVAAAVILIVGACTGGTQDVLAKAVNICTECVGLG